MQATAYFLTEIGLTPGGSSTIHIYTQTIHRTTQSTQTIHTTTQLSAGRAPSLRVIPWHLPYNLGKSTEKSAITLHQGFSVWGREHKSLSLAGLKPENKLLSTVHDYDLKRRTPPPPGSEIMLVCSGPLSSTWPQTR